MFERHRIGVQRAGAICLIGLGTLLFTRASDVASVSDDEIATLVRRLVSPNEAPVTENSSTRYPPGYDKAAQKVVNRAFHQLRKLAPRCFPFLFDHLNDRRYALTVDTGDVDRNFTVGELCRDIIASHLQSDVWDHKRFGTAFRRRPNQPDYLAHHRLFDPESAKKWWESRKDKSLRELQVEVLEWVLAEETNASDKYSDADRQKVREDLSELRASKTPRQPSYPFAR